MSFKGWRVKGQEIASDDHELVQIVPVVKKLLKKLSKCTMEQANNVRKSRLIF